MIDHFFTGLKKNLPYPIFNLLRALRGVLQNLLAKRLPAPFLSRKFKLIKARLNNDVVKIDGDPWNSAFLEYAAGTNETINLLWVDGPMHLGNFGDWLSPYILKKISGQRINHVPDYSLFPDKHMIGIGSIARKINRDSHVFGTGIHSINDSINPDAIFYFVRGPYTRKRLLECGGPKVDFLGDMGFILSKIYNNNVQKRNKVLLVRHTIHQDIPLMLGNDIVEYSINASNSKTIENFIDEILASHVVITSAMHCYIACMSYGIPCLLIDFKDSKKSFFGDGIKYLDASEGAGLKKMNRLTLGLDLRNIDFANHVSAEGVNQAFIDDLFEHVQMSIKKFNEK